MLKILRKKGLMKKLLWAVAIIIILVFGLMGKAYLIQDKNQTAYAGMIFGKKISFAKFQKNLHQTYIQALLQYGDNLDKVQKMLNLEAETWNRIILLYEADKRKIKISNQDVVNAINSFEFFKRDGEFDKLLYNDILNSAFKIDPRDYEEGVRDSLKIARLFEEETFSISVPDDEIFEAYKTKNEKVQVSYVSFNAKDYKDSVTFNEEEAKQYYNEHKDEFIRPPMVNVEYIRIDYPEEVFNTIPESDPAQKEDTKTQENSTNELDQEIEEKQRVIEELKEKTFDKSLEVLNELSTNTNFEQVANSHGLSAETSGFFSMEQPKLVTGWSFPLIQQIFQLETEEISEPIETSLGYQILRIKERKGSYVPEYAEAQKDVQDAWISKEAKQITEEVAKKALQQLKEQISKIKLPDFAQIAKDNNMELNQTPVFSRGQYLPQIGISKDFQDTAFSLTENQRLSNVIEIPKGYCIQYLDAIIPIDQKEFEKEKNIFAENLLMQRKSMAFNEFVSLLRQKANLVNNVEKMKEEKEVQQ